MNLATISKYIDSMKRQIHRSSYTRPRLVLRPHQRLRTTLKRNLLVGGSLLLLNASFAFAYFYFGKTDKTHAAQLRNGGNGNWNSSSTWTMGRVPQELVVYPNPVTQGEPVTIQVPAENEKSIQVFVTDIQGKQIFTKSFEKENASDNIIRCVTEKFPATGTYFITASGLTNTYLKKIVVL
jgi:hypothetical protein